MGISDIFEDGKSNLSGLLEDSEPLSISDAIHKAIIEVNEKGTGKTRILILSLKKLMKFDLKHKVSYIVKTTFVNTINFVLIHRSVSCHR